MKHIRSTFGRIRRGVTLTTAAALLGTTAVALQATGAQAASGRGNAVLTWNEQIVASLRAEARATGRSTPPPAGARAFAIVHTCVYDAWAAYDSKAVGTRLGGELRRPRAERTAANKRKAVSFAAHRALGSLFPAQQAHLDAALGRLGYAPGDPSSAAATAVKACDAVLAARAEDGSTLPDDYRPVNAPQDVDRFDPAALTHPDRWAPLTQNGVTQSFVTPQYGAVAPFVIDDPADFPVPAPPAYGTPAAKAQIEKQLERNASLTDRQKAIAEYWMFPAETSSAIPQRWAAFVSRRDRHTLDQDVKMFFALNTAEADAGVVIWRTKRGFDYARPLTMIRYDRAGQLVRGWAGPGKGTRLIDGKDWRPYLGTPAFPAYGSGHTGFTATGAEVLRLFTGSDSYGDSDTVRAGSSAIEPGRVPARDVTLRWPTFSAAADEVGASRLYGGVHWEGDHEQGTRQGREVAHAVWSEARQYFDGTHPSAH